MLHIAQFVVVELEAEVLVAELEDKRYLVYQEGFQQPFEGSRTRVMQILFQIAEYHLVLYLQMQLVALKTQLMQHHHFLQLFQHQHLPKDPNSFY